MTYTSWTEQEGLPSWLRPFNIDSRSRFTRTPEVLIQARSRGRDSVPEVVEPAPAVPLPEAEAETPAPLPETSSFSALPGTLEDDEVFIDWTGQTWAARIAAEAGDVPQDIPAEASPVEGEGEPAVLADAAQLPESPAEALLVTAEPVPEHEPEPVPPEAANDVLPAIARLGRLILVAPVLPAPVAEQDLRPVPVPEEVAEVATIGAASEIVVPEDISAAPVEAVIETAPEAVAPSEEDAPEALASEEAAPEALAAEAVETVSDAEEAPAPVLAASPVEHAPEAAIAVPPAELAEPVMPVAESMAPAAALSFAPVPFLGLGLQVGASLGWSFSAPAAPAATPIEEPAPQVLRRQVEPAAPVVPEPQVVATVAPSDGGYELPPLDLLTEPPLVEPAFEMSEEFLDRNSAVLQQTLRDFGVRGEVIDANPGPVVTLYEFEPAPGTKSSRVIGLSADIARSMSAVSARVAVVEGRNVIGIELPNQKRETVWLRELIANHTFPDARARLGICLGKTIGGEPVIVDLARMPHLLVAGTTGSGKSVAINTMILSLLYRLTPEQCRLIMIDPKMLELSVYEGIPHLLTPVVTDPKKAIIALQWAVREMEDRYRKMARLKVRNIEGFNARVAEAREKGEVITFTIERGFDRETGETVVEEATLDLTPLPYIVIIVDEMADLMMVAGKDIEGAIQRLAQMARAAGIHLVMATQRPSVDVITGTIKANFPTRISFQVTSKIDSRTILGEMGAETLLGQGDMLYMANGGRITRVHGPFVSDGEVEKVVAHLKAQGRPEYLDAVTADEEDDDEADEGAVFDRSAMAAEDGADHYEQAVAIVLRDRKASTSYIQRRLQIGYNKAASLMERMENEGIVGPANHAGKREILSGRQG